MGKVNAEEGNPTWETGSGAVNKNGLKMFAMRDSMHNEKIGNLRSCTIVQLGVPSQIRVCCLPHIVTRIQVPFTQIR